jgi:hypothetical protein
MMLTMEPYALHVDQDISAVQGGAAYVMDSREWCAGPVRRRHQRRILAGP